MTDLSITAAIRRPERHAGTTARGRAARRHALALAAAAVATLAAGPAFAQAWPSQPIKLTVGFPPGTGPDVVARVVGQKLAETLKATVTIENRAGAGGQIATQAVARSAPDGYNLLLAEVGSIAIAPAAFSKLPYKPLAELVPISEVVRSDFVLAVPLQSPYRSYADFVAGAKASKDRINFATFGPGTPGHFGAEMLAEQNGFKVEPVHYRATGDAVTAIVAGDVQGAFLSTAMATAQIKGGKLRGLATTGAERSRQLPDVQTFAQVGNPKLDFSSWFIVFAPTGTPAPIVQSLNQALVAAVTSGDARQKLEEAGFRIVGGSQADATRLVKDETARWAQIVKATGFKGD